MNNKFTLLYIIVYVSGTVYQTNDSEIAFARADSDEGIIGMFSKEDDWLYIRVA